MQTNVQVGGRQLIASGVVVLEPADGDILIDVPTLTTRIRLRYDQQKPAAAVEVLYENDVNLIDLINFRNPIGSSYAVETEPDQLGRTSLIRIVVHSVGDLPQAMKVLSYSFYMQMQ